MESCNYFWGGHGCDKPPGHEESGDKIHRCGELEEDHVDACSEMDEEKKLVRYRYVMFEEDEEDPGWSEWLPTVGGWRM